MFAVDKRHFGLTWGKIWAFFRVKINDRLSVAEGRAQIHCNCSVQNRTRALRDTCSFVSTCVCKQAVSVVCPSADTPVCMYVCVCMCACVRAVCMYACMYVVCMYVCMCVCMYVYVCVCMHVCVCACVCARVCMCVWTVRTSAAPYTLPVLLNGFHFASFISGTCELVTIKTLTASKVRRASLKHILSKSW
jgi:hypothetical protein